MPSSRPLPTEIISLVCEILLEDKGYATLLSVQRSSQAGWDAATPFIYRQAMLSAPWDYASLFRAAIVHPIKDYIEPHREEWSQEMKEMYDMLGEPQPKSKNKPTSTPEPTAESADTAEDTTPLPPPLKLEELPKAWQRMLKACKYIERLVIRSGTPYELYHTMTEVISVVKALGIEHLMPQATRCVFDSRTIMNGNGGHWGAGCSFHGIESSRIISPTKICVLDHGANADINYALHRLQKEWTKVKEVSIHSDTALRVLHVAWIGRWNHFYPDSTIGHPQDQYHRAERIDGFVNQSLDACKEHPDRLMKTAWQIHTKWKSDDIAEIKKFLGQHAAQIRQGFKKVLDDPENAWSSEAKQLAQMFVEKPRFYHGRTGDKCDVCKDAIAPAPPINLAPFLFGNRSFPWAK